MTRHTYPDAATSRRRVLRVGGAAALGSLAGCTAAVDRLANRVLGDVNVLNQLGRTVSGSIEIAGPSDETVLAEAFDAPSTESGGESNVVAYDDVWEETGAHGVAIELTDVELEGVSRASETVSIGDVDEEMVGVLVGSGIEDEPIAIRAGESLSEFGGAAENGSS
jgi:hypothetical protein